VSYDLIPGMSGAWTTNCDLLERDHELTFLCARVNNSTRIEGKDIHKFDYDHSRLKFKLKQIWETLQFDFCLCLGDRESQACAELNIPFMTRYHTLPFNIELARKVKDHAFWTIENHDLPELNGIRDNVIPHCINPERYTECYEYHLKTEWSEEINVVLLATLNHVEDPFTFIKAMRLCEKNITGYIIGSGVLSNEVKARCDNSRGRSIYLGGKNRNELPKYLKLMNVGVACLSPQSKNNRQLKILEYCAGGIYPILSVNSKKEDSFSVLKYKDANNLVSNINFIAGKVPLSDLLKYNRNIIMEKWNALKWANTFNEKLEVKFNARR